MRTAAIRPASLDAPIGDDDSNNFSEVVQDENADTPYQHLEEKTVTKMLQEMVTTLDIREATILATVSVWMGEVKKPSKKSASGSGSPASESAKSKILP